MQEPAPGDVDADAWELMLTVHRLTRLMRGCAGHSGLSPTRLLVLSILAERGPVRVGTLAALVPCSQPSATTLVAHLESEGLVRRAPDPDDGRAVVVTLTDQGRQHLRSLAVGGALVLRDRLAALPEARRDTISAALPLLRDLCGDPPTANADQRLPVAER
jgi:DNA-binding MarR family transcriptional regulator